MAKSRILTLEQLRKAKACPSGQRLFRKLWGTQVEVNQKWALEAAQHFSSLDGVWCYCSLLPVKYQSIVWDVRLLYFNKPYDVWNRVTWAIFAALYVEADDV